MKAAIIGFASLIGTCSMATAVVVEQTTELHSSGSVVSGASSGQTDLSPLSTPSTSALPASTLAPFTARYKSEWDVGFFSIDIEGTRSLEQLSDGQWRLTFKADSSAASLKEISTFELADGQIQPLDYQYQVSGLVTEPNRHLQFLPMQEIVRDHKKNRDHTNQDAQTYMLQASLDLALHPTLPLSYPVFEKKKTKLFNFEIVGEEVIKSPLGKLNTVKIRQVRKDSREVIVWLDKDRQYLLARLIDKKKGKTRYRIDLVDIDS